MVSKTSIEVIRSRVLNLSRNSYALEVIGSVIVGISLIGIVYFGSITIRDASTGNVSEGNSLPITNFGPFSGYHLEYSSVFALIFGTVLLCFGVFGKPQTTHKKRMFKRS